VERAAHGDEGLLRHILVNLLTNAVKYSREGCAVELRARTETATTPFILLTAKGEKPDIRAGMNLGADDYLLKPVVKAELPAAIRARFEREAARERELDVKVAQARAFKPNFESSTPLEQRLNLTGREAEVLL